MLDVFIILRCPDKKNSNKGHFNNVYNAEATVFDRTLIYV